MAEIKGLSKRLTEEDKEKILEDFQAKLLDFCEAVLYNGSRRGDEWDCADIYNSELTEGDRGSCSVNLVGRGFNDQNPDASPQKGGYHLMFCSIFGLKGVAGWRAMQKWNEEDILPDGSKANATGRKVELEEGSSIEALNDDAFEKDRIKWIQTFQNWTAWTETHGVPKPTISGAKVFFDNRNVEDINDAEYIAETKAKNDHKIAWAISDIFTRRWSWASEMTRDPTTREKFVSELAAYRSLSKEVFYWLVDQCEIVCMWVHKEFKQEPIIDEDGGVTQPPPNVADYFDIAFPVYRKVTPEDVIPEWAGSEDFIQKGGPHQRVKAPDILFLGMHMHYVNSKGKHWMYSPRGCTVHPWIIGDISKADLVVIAESTWDIIAYLDLRKMYNWKRTPWCAIATRGASNAARIPADQIKDGASVVRLLQNDAGNAAWVASLPPMPQAKHKELQPPTEDKDLNDWMRREGADNVHLKHYGNRRP